LGALLHFGADIAFLALGLMAERSRNGFVLFDIVNSHQDGATRGAGPMDAARKGG
jgi:hypothetical protein